MAPLRAASRSALVYAIDATIVLLLPILWASRQIAHLVLRHKRFSIWTGAPIITVAKNSRAERLLGFDSYSVVRTSYYITDEFDWVIDRVAKGNRAMAFGLTYLAFVAICVLAQQVHGYVEGGLLPGRKRRHFNTLELLVYRVLGIRLIIWTYGADVRTRNATVELGHPNCCSDCPQIGSACICDDIDGAKNYDCVARQATAVFSMGDMIEYTPGSRNDLFFWPIDLAIQGGKRYKPAYPSVDLDRPVRVVHAPNHSHFKGTRYLEQAIASLQQEGVGIELILVERLSNDQALEVYRSADVIFDQCLIGFHGYFALEAMALGKPVMCFIRKPAEYLLQPEECPIINTHVDTLKADLRSLVRRRDEFEDIGRRGRLYIERNFSLEAFAGRLQSAYRDLGIAI
jgi:hypothetical protein